LKRFFFLRKEERKLEKGFFPREMRNRNLKSFIPLVQYSFTYTTSIKNRQRRTNCGVAILCFCGCCWGQRGAENVVQRNHPSTLRVALVGGKDNRRLGRRSRLVMRSLFSCHQNSALCCFDNVALVPLC
jgi:hypothetical protein